MTDFLVKCFVKDHDKTEDPQVRTRYGILASIVGICCNLLLFASKLFIGVLVNSVSVMADAFNNLSDAASSIIGFIGVRMAGKPADSDHPFGHGRIEYISAFIVAFLVIQVGFSLFKTSLGKVLHPEEVYFTGKQDQFQGDGGNRCRCHGRCNDYQCSHFIPSCFEIFKLEY